MPGRRREPRGCSWPGRSPQASLPARVCKGTADTSPPFSGVGLAFLFSWLLILLVFATFLVGGNIQTLVCRNWVNQEIYKVGDHTSTCHPINLCLCAPKYLQILCDLPLNPSGKASSRTRRLKFRIGSLDLHQQQGIALVLLILSR